MPDLAEFAASPDPAHAALAAAALDAITSLANHLLWLQANCLLSQTAADFAQTVLTNFGQLSASVTALSATVTSQGQDITTLQSQVATLQGQVAGLLTPPVLP